MKLRTKKIFVFYAVIFTVLVGMVSSFAVYKSQSPKAIKFKKQVKNILTDVKLPSIPSETKNLGKIIKTNIYENNSPVNTSNFNPTRDNKKIYITDKEIRLINYSKGFMMDFPFGTKFDFSLSPIVTKAKNDIYEVTISREYSPYEDVQGYINHYLNRFIDSKTYQAANNISYFLKKSGTLNGNKMEIISVALNNMPPDKLNGYTYVTVRTDTRVFFRLMFKYKAEDIRFKNELLKSLTGFSYFKPTGEAVYNIDFHPQLPKNWSKETLQLYNTIVSSKKLRWGIFAKDIFTEGIDKTVPEIEKKINYKFPVILSYRHFKMEFPLEFMRKNYNNGKIVELTYQITESNNENLFGYTPNIDMYRGLKDEDIRKFARGAKAFGHPFLFRLNNEMNSDWTSYSGVINMSDPEIYIDNWRRIAKIFKEEGVNNVIWIFNPNDRNFPPCDWNNYLLYYPGNEYVQMIGVTGYNTGTYYKKEMGEEWRDFELIYDEIQNKYEPFFSKFPWIITEFSSSSVGGDKVKWINTMFNKIGKYQNIKIAVWFSYADYDFRLKNKVARPYWLDETPQTTEAFKNGIIKNSVEGWENP